MLVSEELYSQILRVMPIPCVDLLVLNEERNVLLLLRKNEPVAHQWWFPGGRVHLGELRIDAAKRKLQQECGLTPAELCESATFDLFLSAAQLERVHFITTLFEAKVNCGRSFQLDDQSEKGCWQTFRQWLKEDLHPFVRQRLEENLSR